MSILIPFYNVEQYLNQCLDSIQKQTYTNIEVLLIDDASTDGSREICEQYVQQDNRFKLIHLPNNNGLANARNLGIANSTGEYILFVDGDDWVEHTIVETLLRAAKENDSDLVTASYYRLDEATGKFQFHNPQFDCSEISFDDFLYKRLAATTAEFTSSWAKLYKRSLFTEPYLLYYPLGVFAEDLFVTHRLFMRAKKLWYVNQGLYCWRRRANSLTTTKISEKAARDVLEAMSQLLIDLLLTGKMTHQATAAYKFSLESLQRQLEEARLQKTEIYAEISIRLSYY